MSFIAIGIARNDISENEKALTPNRISDSMTEFYCHIDSV